MPAAQYFCFAKSIYGFAIRYDINPRLRSKHMECLKPRGVEHRQPHSGSFVCIFPYPSRLAPASLRRLRKNPKQNFSLWGATQFSESCFSARQEKSRREYPLVFSRDFPQYWRKATWKNLTGFDSPQLNHYTICVKVIIQ